MSKTSDVVFRFRNDDERESFIVWFIDVAGDQQYGNFCESHNIVEPYATPTDDNWNDITMLVEENE